MAMRYRIGDEVALPSGRIVRLSCAALPERPWTAVETGYLWHIVREHGLDAGGVSFYFAPGRKVPLQLSDELDARSLALALNQTR